MSHSRANPTSTVESANRWRTERHAIQSWALKKKTNSLSLSPVKTGVGSLILAEECLKCLRKTDWRCSKLSPGWKINLKFKLLNAKISITKRTSTTCEFPQSTEQSPFNTSYSNFLRWFCNGFGISKSWLKREELIQIICLWGYYYYCYVGKTLNRPFRL